MSDCEDVQADLDLQCPCNVFWQIKAIEDSHAEPLINLYSQPAFFFHIYGESKAKLFDKWNKYENDTENNLCK